VKRGWWRSIFVGLLLCWALVVMAKPQRPRILGIEGVEIYVSDAAASNQFYRKVTSLNEVCDRCERQMPQVTSILLPGSQIIKLSSTRSAQPLNLLNSITFEVDDETAMKKFLQANGVPFKEYPRRSKEEGAYLSVVDPEGHQILFAGPLFWRIKTPPPSVHLIHAGFMVKDRAAMDRFYKDILGFRLYWHGGMTDDQTQWVDMQVPDGTDWIEYMLNIPADADKHTLGVMNHIALGVPDVKAAVKALEANGMKLTEQPKIGRDGKWQLNLYDPDQTRVELMEFTPVEKPCCAEYTGPHPKP
jgi:catechol 2,3-dioxygenase-like lactoylglutathione lyase family enzyme